MFDLCVANTRYNILISSYVYVLFHTTFKSEINFHTAKFRFFLINASVYFLVFSVSAVYITQ